ncbi:MAG: microcin ABC transporter permease [Candidatus Puniceispirillum sp.]|nr:microcin ABC transporter permease [Candidatus Puniceispirillum sp.]
MLAYICRRLLLMIPTLFGILLVNFIIIQAAPGGPVEQMIAKIRGTAVDATARFAGGGADTNAFSDVTSHGMESKYQGSRGLDPEFIKQLEKMYGFDKPAPERFWIMIKNYLTFDFGESYFRDTKVIQLIKEKLPVSISLGLWSTLLIYMISIPLGIRKAVEDGQAFDLWTSAVVVIGYAIPSFLFAILLVVLFAGGSFWNLFPLRGIVSEGWETFSLWHRVTDYVWHMALPIFALVISGFASLTLLTKNAFLEEIGKQYVLTARSKGLSAKRVLYGHVFRNAMLVVVAGLPAAFMHVFFTGSLLIEVIFSLDGMGLLSFEAAMGRDYPIVFATLYIFTLVGLATHLMADITYTLVDPRIDFEKRLG